jgi:hypothetical protein
LQTTIKSVFALGLIVAAGAFLAGPAPLVVRLRLGTVKIYHAARETQSRLDLGPAGKWINRQKNILRGAGVAVALIAIVAISQPSALQVLLIAILLLIYLGALEFLARKAA